jgi:hypothetical protein
MTNEQTAIIAQMPESEWTPLGFGPPMDTTRELEAMGLIEIDAREENNSVYWRARLTQRGQRARK